MATNNTGVEQYVAARDFQMRPSRICIPVRRMKIRYETDRDIV